LKAGIVLAVLLAAAFAAWSTISPRAAHILVSDAVLTPLEDGSLAGFARLENTGTPDRLVAVSSPTGNATLYDPAQAGRLPVPQGSVALAADSAHIRLDAQGLEDGTLVPLTLTFEHAGEVNLKARLSDPTKQGGAEEVGLFGLGDICIVGDGEPAPQIALHVHPEGDGWRVEIAAEEFTWSEDLVGLYHVPGMGHGHIYVGGMKLGRLYGPTAHIGALPPGEHAVRVTLNTNDHRAYVVDDVPVVAEAVIKVD
jgi:copper(I)-binding protein